MFQTRKTIAPFKRFPTQDRRRIRVGRLHNIVNERRAAQLTVCRQFHEFFYVARTGKSGGKRRRFGQLMLRSAYKVGWLKGWLGRQDSNLGMSVPKTDALPLGDAPSRAPFPAARKLRDFQLQSSSTAVDAENVAIRPGKAQPPPAGRPGDSVFPRAMQWPVGMFSPSVAGQAQTPLRAAPSAVIGGRLVSADRSVAQPGRALSSGGRGRVFESPHSDHFFPYDFRMSGTSFPAA